MAVVTWPLAVLAIAIAITIAILVKVLMQGGVVTAGRPGDYGRAYLTIRSDALTNEKLPYAITYKHENINDSIMAQSWPHLFVTSFCLRPFCPLRPEEDFLHRTK